MMIINEKYIKGRGRVMKMQGALKKFPEVFKITKMETNTLVKGK